MNNSSSSISATRTSFSKTVAATVPPVASTTTRPYTTTASNNDCKNTIASTATVTITNAVTLPASTVFPKDCHGITSHSGITPTSSQIAAPTSQTTGTGEVNSSCDNTMAQSTSTTTVTVTKSSASYGPKTCLITETMKTTLTEVAYGCPVSTTMISEIGTSILPPSSATNTKARPTNKNSGMSSDKTLATTSSETKRASMTSNTSPSRALSSTKGNQLSSSSIRNTITTTPLSSRATSRATSRAATTKHSINSSSSASTSVATTRTTNGQSILSTKTYS
ncbi:hypothetical protein INT45_003969 [Circinella minor]|uniref:Uncharacterized protein n=1 Tax=Circinella minor TaxID=1195481 RepID=A0A8H7RWT4_9FUNG|nr:hypothetical protein INT45_003969 [Circinella minor]